MHLQGLVINGLLHLQLLERVDRQTLRSLVLAERDALLILRVEVHHSNEFHVEVQKLRGNLLAADGDSHLD